MHKRVKIVDIDGEEPSYKVMDMDTGDGLILDANGSLMNILNEINDNNWELAFRETVDGKKYKLLEKEKSSFGWEEI